MTPAPRSREQVVAMLRRVGIIPVIRANTTESAVRVAEALAGAGLHVVEIALTVPGAIDAIAQLHRVLGDEILIGAGTVTDADAAHAAIEAGARFLVSPSLAPDVIVVANAAAVTMLAGALTPTEVFAAHQAGADFIKVFPAQAVGGPSYIRSLSGPFPDIPLVPTGGVTLQTVADYVAAGAVALGVGSELVNRAALGRGDYASIAATAGQFMAALRSARGAD